MIILIILLLLACLGGLLWAGKKYGWGPFRQKHRSALKKMAGNDPKYDSAKLQPSRETILKGKNVLFLGSSVTYGAASLQDGIPEYFAQRLGCISTKEAVNGTTLVDNGPDSYISRMKANVSTEKEFSLVVCQLSTNDARLEMPLGELSDSDDLNAFDTHTVAGAIEYIIAYSKQNWNCPVMFYTGSRYESDNYAKMVDLIFAIANKWGIGVIDLWHSEEFNAIRPEQRALYMHDPVHPFKAGYMEWWCPEMEKQLLQFLKNGNS